MDRETPLWKGNPSQLTNFWYFVFSIIGATIIGEEDLEFNSKISAYLLILLPSVVVFLKIFCTSYHLSNKRLKLKKGVINQKIEATELYRIQDYSLNKPLWLRMFNLGHLTLHSSDKTDPTIQLKAIRNVEKVSDLIRYHVEDRRIVTQTRDVIISK
jgi:uncharacterized membrane protein YdbT with pleckstrin-like domain